MARFRVFRVLFLVFAMCAFIVLLPFGAHAAPLALSGIVVDQSTGLALPGATIVAEPGGATARADAAGHFSLALGAGRYVLRAAHDGYQPAVAAGVTIAAGSTASVTLALQRASNDLSVIAVTTSRAADSLRKSSTFYRALDAEQLQRDGVERAADALRTLPGVNNGITGDTGTFADDVNLNIRGLGTLETEATLDGHPIGFGFPGGYNYNLSPLFALRNVQVTYGSGAQSLSGVDAIGGVVDFQTLDPTPERQFTAMQGFGTFAQYVTSFRTTGTSNRIGYAGAYGVSTIDGPIVGASLYEPGAAFDQSATAPAVRDLAVYTDDSTAVSRSGLAKLVYSMDPYDRVSFTALASSIWDDKTGNGDGDYLEYAPALVFGQHLLAVKGASDPCASGTFSATNANGVPNGTGPDGQPDGGQRCQTPAQWAAYNTGYQGAGPAWQSFDLQDEHVAATHESRHSALTLDAYTSRFAQTFDRTWQLPFTAVPGDRALWRNRQVVETGAKLANDVYADRNEFGYGASWMNDAYALDQDGKRVGDPLTHETALFLRDVFHPAAKMYAYANVWFKNAGGAANASYVDSRASLVYTPGTNDVVRYAIGKTTAQPTADMLGKQFVESPPGNAGGGASITCSGLNSIGTAPSSVLQPERGVDQELGFAHRFSGDTQIQIALYDVDVYQKLYSTLVPLSAAGASYIDPAYLAQVSSIVASKCGPSGVLAHLGVSGTFNVGELRSRGFAVDGRWRFSKRTYVDYDWAATSTAILAAPQQLLKSNLTLISGSQLPRVPLHTLDVSLDNTFGRAFDVRYTLHAVSANNTKALPAYAYSDLTATHPMANGFLAVTLGNVFNQDASALGLRYEGVPLALNGYATAAAYAPVIGSAATEQFGLPSRSLFLSYTARVGP